MNGEINITARLGTMTYDVTLSNNLAYQPLEQAVAAAALPLMS